MSTLENRIAVRELYGRYAVASAKRNFEEWLACWSRDARWITAHFEVTGHDRLRQQWDGIWTTFVNVAAFNEIGEVWFTGDTATTHCSVLEMITMANGAIVTMAGLYDDTLVRDEGVWRFASRSYQGLSQTAA